ncbi:response regulator [bacterium]|nr:response regulator [bacterium]
MSCILLVDDEKNVLKTLSMGLRRLDYGVEEAQTGPEALELLGKKSVDVVVSDIRMSPMDGYTLASEIKKLHPQIPVILMSAYGFESQQVEERDGVIYPKITKPFSVHQLVDKVKEVENTWNPGTKKVSFKILLFSDEKTLEKIRSHLKGTGLEIVGFGSRDAFLQYLDAGTIDCFLIDELYLDQSQWKILNDIDSRAPGKPVILLVESQGANLQHTVKDTGVIMLNRNTFFKDRGWMEKYIHNHLKQSA